MKKRTVILVLALIILALLIFLNNNFAPIKIFTSVIQNIFAGPKASIYNLRTGDDLRNSEIKKLKDENIKLTQKLVEFERIKRDNEALRSQFETGATRQYKLIPARVLGFLGRFAAPVTLIIDRGEQDGVRKGMAIIYKNNFIGRIVKVSSSYSQIELANNLNFQSLGVTSLSNIPGIIKGEEDFILFDRVTINENITPGEVIVTKGEINEEGFGIPPELVIGEIVSVSKNESASFQSAKVESQLRFSRLNTVFVVLGL